MELLIRSQDKHILENVKGFCITYGNETHWNIVNIDTTTRYGTYKTEKRALEVLDEIQDILDTKKSYEKFAHLITKDTKIIEFSNVIYEMPKE